jgi:hypothetical protein
VTLPGPSSASWWIRSSDGRLALGQLPNPALCVWLVALAVGWELLSAVATSPRQRWELPQARPRTNPRWRTSFNTPTSAVTSSSPSRSATAT